MKTEFTEVSETRKHLTFEVPPDVVEAEIDRVARRYSQSARVPGFRQGKVPARVVRQRYKHEILHDVTHDLIPRLVGEALRERGLEPVAAPDIKDLVLEDGQPMSFVADFETLPPIDPGEYAGLSLRRKPAVLEVGAVDRALDHLQERHARWQPVEDRPAQLGDTLLLDLTRTRQSRLITMPGEAEPPKPSPEDGKPEALENVTVELGATANPPGFDENLAGTTAGDTRQFTVTYPAEYEIAELAGATVDYAVTIKGVRRKELLPLDDEFAKEVSDLETLEALRDRIREDLQRGAEQESEHEMRHELLQVLGSRLKVAPDVLVDAEIDRRLEEFVRRLVEQGLDPMQVGVDWQEFRERQREAAAQTVKSTLVVDEIGRRESIEATEADLEAEIEKFGERAGRASAAIRARLEKEGALDRLRAGIVREKTMAWLIEHATVSS
jgi:trigger factor